MILIAGISAVAGCNENESEKDSDGGFDVRFVVPAGVETVNDSVSFEVIGGRAPLLTDSFIFEPVSNSNLSYPCTIVEKSPESFTVKINSTISSGPYNIYIKRGSERESYGSIYLAAVRIGETLPNWFEGELDIHCISTGRGEGTYLIFPDGTTFLVDAGDIVSPDTSSGGQAPFKPNEDITAGQAIVDYINHFSPSVSEGCLNYFLATHHHTDHIGAYSTSRPSHSSGLFRESGVAEVGARLVMERLFDGDWPDFSCPAGSTSSTMTNYIAYLDWTSSTNGSVVEKWRVGCRTQVVPVHSSAYDVTVRSYAGGAYFWTGGTDEDVYTLMPDDLSALSDDDMPNENCFSCAFILSYGKFDYFNGGDLQHSNSSISAETVRQPYWDAESPMASAVHKVEVMEANHHGCSGTHATELINKLAPDVWFVASRANISQPHQKSSARVIDANPDVEIFSTYESSDNMSRLVSNLGQDVVDRHLVSLYGHIVVRVVPGGDSYMVYTLEDSDEEYVVKSIHGPYYCSDPE